MGRYIFKMIHGYILLTVLSSVVTFNIHTTPVGRFSKKDEKQFGQTIIPYKNGILVATSNSTVRKLHHCTLEKNCTELTIKGNATKGLKPIVSAAKSLNGDQFVICQQVRRRQSEDEDLNGECNLMSDPLTVEVTLPPAARVVEQMKNDITKNKSTLEETNGKTRSKRANRNNNNNNNYEDEEDAGTEIAFVLDGSGSIEPEDFKKAKKFICDIMKKVWESCFSCNFAVVQYGNVVQPELLLSENAESEKALMKVQNIKQIEKYTITASAVNYVLEHVFVPENGSKENSRKIIIVLTDGEITEDKMDLATVLNSPKMKGITRFAIGVGEATRGKGQKELQQIALEPHDKHLFMVNDYGALEDYLQQLETSIIGIEGIQQGAAFHFTLSEAGFSSHLAHDGSRLFGAVGAYDWSGGVILSYPTNNRVKFLNTTSTGKEFSYLGYSVTSARTPSFSLYISGAPRHNLSGAVFVFVEPSQKSIQTLYGKQVGSYFGSVLCALDLDRDQKTDYLLVGAPFFHAEGEEGKVYIYKLEEGKFTEEYWEMEGMDKYIFARFGSTITDIGDIDGNSYNDVAVGAPLEEDNGQSSGSIYIFNGYEGGIRNRFSQRISAAHFETGLQYFGQAITKMSDQYLAVGSEGMVTILEAVAVIQLSPTIQADPKIISLSQTEKNIKLKICFKPKRGGVKEGHLFILYKVDLDAKQEEKRLIFVNGLKSSTDGTFSLTKEINCPDLMITKLKACTDCFSPIEIRLKFQLVNESGNIPSRVLDAFSPMESTIQIPFEVNCSREVCVPQISISNSKLSTDIVVLGVTKNLNIDFNLTNEGEQSFRTNLLLTYPDVFKFNKVSKNAGSIVCINEESQFQLKCRISYPMLEQFAKAIFSISLQPVKEISMKTVSISSTLTCENNGIQILDRKNYTLRMKKALKVQLTGKVDRSVLNIAEDKGVEEQFKFTFEIMGENKYNALITVTINILLSPPELKIQMGMLKENCTWKSNTSIQCMARMLPKEIVVEGNVVIDKNQMLVSNIQATASLSFDQEVYDAEETYEPVSQTMTINKLKVVSSTSAIIGGSMGGFILLIIIIIILFQFGFFRRRYQESRKAQTESHNIQPLDDN
ncbi:integrin alpha-E-like [Brienomyrus brachyistius]|uniref:integrin alpha-E-like n=1 Tax=Brienomyrus brachyistius TaxID=42636 RepID=UPI0020B44E49|nr:integrin alpha-E-like [Brienomyrus brachyistius]